MMDILGTVGDVKRTGAHADAETHRSRKADRKPHAGVSQAGGRIVKEPASSKTKRQRALRVPVPRQNGKGALRRPLRESEPVLGPEPDPDPDPEPEPDVPEVLVELGFQRAGVLGLEFDCSWAVVSIEPGSLAASQPAVLDGRLQLGMQLVRIGSEGVRLNQGDMSVFGALHDAGLPLRLGFAQATALDRTAATSAASTTDSQGASRAQPEVLTRKEATARQRLAQMAAEHEAVLAAAMATGKDAAAVSIKIEKERKRAQLEADLEAQAAQQVAASALAWHYRPLPYRAVSAPRLTVRESASLDSRSCGVLEPGKHVVVTRRAVAIIAPVPGKLVPQPSVVVCLEYKAAGGAAVLPSRGWISVGGEPAFIAVDGDTDSQGRKDARVATQDSGFLAAAEETRPAEVVDIFADYKAAAERAELAETQSKRDRAVEQETNAGALDVLSPAARRLIAAAKADEVAAAATSVGAAKPALKDQSGLSALDALSPSAQRLIKAAKEDEALMAAVTAPVGDYMTENADYATAPQFLEPEPEPEPEAFQTADAGIDYVLEGESYSNEVQDEPSKAALLDELAALEAELQELGGDSMTETESVYGTERSVSQIGSRTEDDADAELHDVMHCSPRQKQVLSETGQLRQELAAIEAEMKTQGIEKDPAADEDEVDEAAEAKDVFVVGDDLQENLEVIMLEETLEHELRAEEDHQFILDSFRSALPVYPLKVSPAQTVQRYTFPQVLTRLRVGQWSDSDALELAWQASYGADEIRLIEITERIRRHTAIQSAVLRLQRQFRMHQAKQLVAEKRAKTYASLKIQAKFRGRTARARVEAYRDQLGTEIFEAIMQFDEDSNGFVDATEFKKYLQAVGEWGTDDLYTDESWDQSWPLVCDLMDVQDPSVGMSADTFVQYTKKYRRDKIHFDVQALRKPVAEEKEAEKRKLAAVLAQKKKLLEHKKMLLDKLDKQAALKKRRREAAAAKMESYALAAEETILAHQTPRPPPPLAEDTM